MVDPASTGARDDPVERAAGEIRACWEDARQEMATPEDCRAAWELAHLGYTAGELVDYLRQQVASGAFARLRDALLELYRPQLGDQVEAEITRRLREIARRQRGAIITALTRELGRRLFPAGVMWALYNPDLSDEEFDLHVTSLRAGNTLTVSDATRRIIDPAAPPPAPREEATAVVEDRPTRPAGPETREPDPDQPAEEDRELDPDEDL